jgi:hypothetical protein
VVCVHSISYIDAVSMHSMCTASSRNRDAHPALTTARTAHTSRLRQYYLTCRGTSRPLLGKASRTSGNTRVARSALRRAVHAVTTAPYTPKHQAPVCVRCREGRSCCVMTALTQNTSRGPKGSAPQTALAAQLQGAQMRLIYSSNVQNQNHCVDASAFTVPQPSARLEPALMPTTPLRTDGSLSPEPSQLIRTRIACRGNTRRVPIGTRTHTHVWFSHSCCGVGFAR